MSEAAEKLSDVVQALQARGFAYIGRSSRNWLRFSGALNAAGIQHSCELGVDPNLFELPTVRLLRLPKSVPPIVPHLRTDGDLCYIAQGSVALDIFDPVGQTIACVLRAEEVVDAVFAGKMVEDLEEEFHAIWGDYSFFADVDLGQPGRSECLIASRSGPAVVLTNNKDRTRAKLKGLNLEAASDRWPAFHVQTSATPRPDQRSWPPRTVGEVLAWQGKLDPRCRRKIGERLLEAARERASGAMIVIQSPRMTYGFIANFDERVTLRSPSTPTSQTSLFSQQVSPVRMVRIDDRYTTQRNIPGVKTFAGKRIALVGAGTIGGYLAEMLVKAGAGIEGGELTIVDPDVVGPQNFGRHRLGFPHLNLNKAVAIKEELERLVPGIQLRALPQDVRTAALGPVDLLIDATGEESLGHWLCKENLAKAAMLSVWVEGPGLAVRGLLRSAPTGACFRCLCDANRSGELKVFAEGTPTVMAGHGCEGLYVPFPASVSMQAACLASEMALDWVNNVGSPTLQTRVIDQGRTLATPDCHPSRRENCPACSS